MEDYSCKMQNNCTHLRTRFTTNGARYIDGCIITPDGIVEVMVQGFDDQTPLLTRFDFAYQGRHYIRTFYETLSKGQIKRRVNTFVKDVMQKEHDL